MYPAATLFVTILVLHEDMQFLAGSPFKDLHLLRQFLTNDICDTHSEL